jgi:CRISPR/Cas system CSM-associated protein Csm3 (group 7 of RAMP superfamily)
MAEKPLVEPYDFVPLGDEPKRKSPSWHNRYHEGQFSGLLECRLTARTPLFVYYDARFVRRVDRGHETVGFPVFGNTAVIPGSSLKGVIRSVVEAVEPCCFTLPSPFPRRYRGTGITRNKEIAVHLPKVFEHCHEKVEVAKDQFQPKALCPACRLFGSLDPGGKWAYAGKASISDARSHQGEYVLMTTPITLDVLSTPKPEGRPNVYTREDGQTIRGRKFYRHRFPPNIIERLADRSGRPKRDHQNKTVQPVKEGSVFHFTVEYSDLEEAELRLLLYGLALEEGLWHKVGMGKPIGLGSAQIEIIKWTRIDRQERYRVLGKGIKEPMEGEALATELAEWLRPYRERQTDSLKKLRDILQPDPNTDVRYVVQPPLARDRDEQ